MVRPWTLPGAEQQKGDIKVSERIPVAEDFDTIRANLERIKREQEQAAKESDQPNNQFDDYYGCGLMDNYDVDYSCSGTETKSLYEEMELLLDENDKIIASHYPKLDRIQRLIEKYHLKVEESHYPYLPNRVLP